MIPTKKSYVLLSYDYSVSILPAIDITPNFSRNLEDVFQSLDTWRHM
jgi:hypothetical protein